MRHSEKIGQIMQCDNIGAGKILSLHWLDCTRAALTFNELHD
jgi:hypothetical protein